MPGEPPRVFLSYGVRDASDIAKRLHRDLTARGYKIWQDIERIRDRLGGSGSKCAEICSSVLYAIY
jgi:hypothetical protein